MFIETLLLVLGLLAISFLALGFNIFFRKGKKFPQTSVGGNKEMRKRGLSCAKHEEIRCRRQIDGTMGKLSCGSCGHA